MFYPQHFEYNVELINFLAFHHTSDYYADFAYSNSISSETLANIAANPKSTKFYNHVYKAALNSGPILPVFDRYNLLNVSFFNSNNIQPMENFYIAPPISSYCNSKFLEIVKRTNLLKNRVALIKDTIGIQAYYKVHSSIGQSSHLLCDTSINYFTRVNCMCCLLPVVFQIDEGQTCQACGISVHNRCSLADFELDKCNPLLSSDWIECDNSKTYELKVYKKSKVGIKGMSIKTSTNTDVSLFFHPEHNSISMASEKKRANYSINDLKGITLIKSSDIYYLDIIFKSKSSLKFIANVSHDVEIWYRRVNQSLKRTLNVTTGASTTTQ